MALLCELAGIARSSYYKWAARKNNPTPKQIEEQALKEKILECHTQLKGIYGYPRVCVWLKKTFGLNINHKRVYRLMKELGFVRALGPGSHTLADGRLGLPQPMC
ncbi:IS3 family transposase [Paenibacillus lautus]